jgi:hypothetical protein
MKQVPVILSYHMVVLSLLNNIKVHVVTHVKVKYRPIVALSDDVVSV